MVIDCGKTDLFGVELAVRAPRAGQIVSRA